MLERLARKLSAVLLGLVATGAATQSAEISSVPAGPSSTLVVVSGELNEGDAVAFKAAANGTSTAAVLLDGPGGLLLEGIAIGRAIHALGIPTGVGPGSVCASACALAWAGGAPRYMSPKALIGFHAAYEDADGEAVSSGVGNALVGAYLSEIGFREEGIVFATSAGPDGMLWLDLVAADKLGIPVKILDEEDESVTPRDDEPIPLQLPSGFRWIVLASSKAAGSLPSIDDVLTPHTMIRVSTSTGYYALVAGPYTTESAAMLLDNWLRAGIAPSDAYLSSGNGFLARLSSGVR